MSASTNIVVVVLLSLIAMCSMATTLWLLVALTNTLTSIHNAICRQNMYLLEWRKEFALVFGFADDSEDDDDGLDYDVWGEEQEQA